MQNYRSKKLKNKKMKHRFILGGGIIIVSIVAGFYLYHQTGGKFVKVGDVVYYKVGKPAVKVTGLRTISGAKYYFSATGAMETGFQTVDGKTMYFDPDTGKMAQGLREIDGYYYYFTTDGTDDTLKAYESVASSLNTGNSVIENTIAAGLKLVGKSPYVYGGGRTTESVNKNEFDCSSFVAEMYRLGGQSLVYQYAASTTLLAETGTATSWTNKSRGDLLVTASDATEEEQHVAIYLGDGFILHDSTSTGGVAVSRLNQVINEKVLGNMTWEQLFENGTVRHEV